MMKYKRIYLSLSLCFYPAGARFTSLSRFSCSFCSFSSWSLLCWSSHSSFILRCGHKKRWSRSWRKEKCHSYCIYQTISFNKHRATFHWFTQTTCRLPPPLLSFSLLLPPSPTWAWTPPEHASLFPATPHVAAVWGDNQIKHNWD